MTQWDQTMLASLTLLLSLPHQGQAGNVLADSLLLSLLDGLTLVMTGDRRGYNREEGSWQDGTEMVTVVTVIRPSQNDI